MSWIYPRPDPACPCCAAETSALLLGRVMLWDCRRCGGQHVGVWSPVDDAWMEPAEELAREMRRAAVVAPCA